jgi:hypothetical protein
LTVRKKAFETKAFVFIFLKVEIIRFRIANSISFVEICSYKIFCLTKITIIMKKLNLNQMASLEGGYIAKSDVNADGASNSFWGGCGGATVGLVFAFGGLATLTAATGGLGTVVAVGGFIAASSAWGATCG